MLLNIYKKIINRFKYEIFNFCEEVNGDKVAIKLKNLNKIKSKEKREIKQNELFKKYSYHPLVYFAQAFANTESNPEKGFEQIKNYDSIRNSWIEKQNLRFVKNEFIPVQQVVGSLGNHFTLFYYLMYKINLERSQEKPNLLLKENQKITNQTLYNFFKPYLNVIQNTSLYYKLVYMSEIFKTPMEISLPFNKNYYPFPVAVNFIQQSMKSVKSKKFDYFNLSESDCKKGKEILSKIGISNDTWYVTMHVREGIRHDFCNSDPKTYLKAIKEITRRGGIVFRMGDRNMTPLSNIDGLIDYPFSDFKSKFMDVFLGATCRFCLGTSSGYWPIPIYFGKPVLLVNYLPVLDYYFLNEENLFLSKHLVDKKNNKPISLEKLFKLPFGFLNNDDIYKKNNIEIIDNSEEEIYEATIEMLDILDGKSKSENFVNKNNNFKQLLDSHNKNKYEFPLKAMANVSTVLLNKYF